MPSLSITNHEICPCLVITGPTATGKTALAVALAHALNSEIFSVDSRQVYRGLDLGTGKDLLEYRNFSPPIPYHLIDVVEPSDVYSLYRFQKECYSQLENFRQRKPEHIPPILVGGTGLYLEAILKRYAIAQIPENPMVRRELEARELADLQNELRRVNPSLFESTDILNKRRVVRALEITLLKDKGSPREDLPLWILKPLVFVMKWDRPSLRQRIAKRLDQRLQEGLVDEVRQLQAKGLSWERLEDLGMEYREIATHLRGAKDFSTMRSDLLQAIQHLAKRQDTWFRGMERRGIKTIPIGPETKLKNVMEIYHLWKQQGYRDPD